MIFRDVLGKRERRDGYPLFASSLKLLSAITDREIPLAFTSPLSLIGVAAESKMRCRYRYEAEELTMDFIDRFIIPHIKIVEVDKEIINKALNQRVSELEDRLVYYCAVKSKSACLATRDVKHMREIGNKLEICTPEDLVGYPRWRRSLRP